MNTFVWNDYYAALAAAVLPQMALRLQPHAPWYIIEVLSILGIAAIATHKWMQEYETTTSSKSVGIPDDVAKWMREHSRGPAIGDK